MGWFCSLLFALSLSLENISRVDNVLKRLYVACAPVVGHLSNSMRSVLKIKKSKIPWCPGGGYNQKSGQIPNNKKRKSLSVMIRSQDLQILKDFSRLPSRHFSRFALCRMRTSHVEDLPRVLEGGFMGCPLEKSVLWI